MPVSSAIASLMRPFGMTTLNVPSEEAANL
jgi:hypothetical protein